MGPAKSATSGASQRAKERKYTESEGRKVLFPEADTFKDIFEQVDSGKKIVAVIKSDYEKGSQMSVSNWVSSSRVGHGVDHSFYATPKKSVIEAIEENMIIVSYDEIYFEIVDRGGGSALVLAKYNQIIGSRYLAFIDPKTIPGYGKKAKKE